MRERKEKRREKREKKREERREKRKERREKRKEKREERKEKREERKEKRREKREKKREERREKRREERGERRGEKRREEKQACNSDTALLGGGNSGQKTTMQSRETELKLTTHSAYLTEGQDLPDQSPRKQQNQNTSYIWQQMRRAFSGT